MTVSIEVNIVGPVMDPNRTDGFFRFSFTIRVSWAQISLRLHWRHHWR